MIPCSDRSDVHVCLVSGMVLFCSSARKRQGSQGFKGPVLFEFLKQWFCIREGSLVKPKHVWDLSVLKAPIVVQRVLISLF